MPFKKAITESSMLQLYMREERFGSLALEEIDQKAKNTTQNPQRLNEKVGNLI